LREHDGVDWTSTLIDVAGARLESLRLYMADTELHGFVLSEQEPPEVLDLALDPDSGEFVPTSTGVTVGAQYTAAGGPDGAVVWFREGNEWRGARWKSAGWAADLGPVSDPNPSGANHTAAATSDGSLYVGWSEDTGSFLDDLGAPFLRRLAPGTSTFEPKTRAGSSVDDYVTTLRLEGRGDGLLVHYCGSDVDPFGLSGTEYRCYAALHPASGAPLLSVGKETTLVRYTFRQGVASAVWCSDRGMEMIPDVVAESAMTTPFEAEVSVWPCAPVLAAEVDGQGELQVIVRQGDNLHSPRVRETR
jgi:hypothetical protein